MTLNNATRRVSGPAAILLIAAVMTGCSGIRDYRASSDRNVRFNTVAESGSWFSSVRATVHIHSVDRNCQTKYQGTIALGRSTLMTGIPSGQPTYLIFAFKSSGFLSNSSSSISYKTLLMPRAGHDYQIGVKYVDDTYDATIREVSRRSRKARKIHHTPLAACRSRSWKKADK